MLVDKSSHTTYAAEANLVPDDSGEEITHQLIDEFFDAFQHGCYVRNDRHWGPPTS